MSDHGRVGMRQQARQMLGSGRFWMWFWTLVLAVMVARQRPGGHDHHRPLKRQRVDCEDQTGGGHGLCLHPAGLERHRLNLSDPAGSVQSRADPVDPAGPTVGPG